VLAGGSTRPVCLNVDGDGEHDVTGKGCCHKVGAMTLALLGSPWPHGRKTLISC